MTTEYEPAQQRACRHAAAGPGEAAEAAAPEASKAMTLASLVSSTMVLTALEPADETQRGWNWCRQLPVKGVRQSAQIFTRSRLTLTRWTGDVEAAARTAAVLADNGARHGQPFPDGSVALRLIVDPETSELLIQVDDADPHFPGFEAAVAKSRSAMSGFGFVQRQRAQLDWYLLLDKEGNPEGKTVQALLPADWEEAA